MRGLNQCHWFLVLPFIDYLNMGLLLNISYCGSGSGLLLRIALHAKTLHRCTFNHDNTHTQYHRLAPIHGCMSEGYTWELFSTISQYCRRQTFVPGSTSRTVWFRDSSVVLCPIWVVLLATVLKNDIPLARSKFQNSNLEIDRTELNGCVASR